MANQKVMKDFVQGDDFKIKVQHKPSFDIAGMQFEVTLKKYENSSSTIMSVVYTVPNDDNAGNGIAYIPITSSDTNIDPGKYYGSVKRIWNGSTVTLVRSGKDSTDKVTCFKNLK